MIQVDLGNDCKNASIKVERGKGKLLMSGLCSIVVPMHRNNLVRDAIKVKCIALSIKKCVYQYNPGFLNCYNY